MISLRKTTLEGKSHLRIPILGIARPQSQIHIHVSVSDLCIPRIGLYFPAAKQAERSWKFINLSQIYECRTRNWETEHYNYCLEVSVSFLGIHKWEPDIYIGFSPALDLQCSHCSRTSKKTLFLLFRIQLFIFFLKVATHFYLKP